MRRVIVTHYHPDHFGLAGWLTQRFGVELWMTRERVPHRAARSLRLPGILRRPARRSVRPPWTGRSTVERQRARGNTYRRGVGEPPARFRRILDGDVIRIDGRSWRVIMGYGHAPEHAALYCEELGVLISGDMVLPKISTNVSVWAARARTAIRSSCFCDSVERYAELPAATLRAALARLPFPWPASGAQPPCTNTTTSACTSCWPRAHTR